MICSSSDSDLAQGVDRTCSKGTIPSNEDTYVRPEEESLRARCQRPELARFPRTRAASSMSTYAGSHRRVERVAPRSGRTLDVLLGVLNGEVEADIAGFVHEERRPSINTRPLATARSARCRHRARAGARSRPAP